ncbi:hypothetical protein FACS189485_12270 [Spirochaetia bacterium]|nr:hypothetical protein FACS189485_12270 [Spirochaetia bacterium]
MGISLEEIRCSGYAGNVTLSDRNTFLKAEILIAALFFIFLAVASAFIIPAYPAAAEETSRRVSGLIQNVIGRSLEPNVYAPFASMAGAVIYALAALILIYYFFEQTPSPEILFFALFVLSLSFEGMRLLVPLQKIRQIPALYLLMASRALLFGRFFGIFSLFAASVYAAGLEMQKQQNIIMIIALITLVITLGVPIDVLSWDTSYCMITGYTSMFRMVEAGMLLITMLSFFISAYSRGSREYILIGVGSFLVFLGRNLLLSADTWVTPLPGLAALTAGTYFICTRLHKVYLWL